MSFRAKNQVRVQLECKDPSLTQQCFRDECDVNMIVKRFALAGGGNILDMVQNHVSGTYGDFSQVMDYRAALDQIKRADEVFMALPAIVRERFRNDAATFLDFVHNPANEQDLISMGLAKPRVEPVQEVKKPVPSAG